MREVEFLVAVAALAAAVGVVGAVARAMVVARQARTGPGVPTEPAAQSGSETPAPAAAPVRVTRPPQRARATFAPPERRLLPRTAAFGIEASDPWPRTVRVLPWLLAGFLVVLWTIPFQDILLPIQLPVDARLDRFVLGGIALLWLVSFFAGGEGSPRLHPSMLDIAVLAFIVIAIASVLFNLPALVNVGDLTLSAKKLALAAAYVMFFYIASTSIRTSEVAAFTGLMIGLACVTAVGVAWEYRAGTNLFYEIARAALPPGFTVLPETGDARFGRPAVTGPTQHGLAAATMLALALPFAVVGVMTARTRGRKILYAVAAAVIFAGAVSTLRKSAIVMPVTAMLVLFVYRPRNMLRLAPVGLVLLILVQAVSPGALGAVRGQLQPDRVGASTSTQGRTADYAGVQPDIKTHLATGRGYGTYDSHTYRLLDNQYLALLVEVGFVGTSAYLLVMLSVLLLAHRTIRSGDPTRGPPALAVAASTGAFVICNVLFDTLAFAQVPYLFFFVADLAAANAAGVRTGARAAGRVALGGTQAVRAGSPA